jgi:hypothetical protein
MQKVVNAKRRMGFDTKENLQICTHKSSDTLIEGQSGGESNSLSRNSFEAAKQNGKVTRPSSRKGRVTVDEPSATCAMAQHIRSVQSSEQKPDDTPAVGTYLCHHRLGIYALNYVLTAVYVHVHFTRICAKFDIFKAAACGKGRRAVW